MATRKLAPPKKSLHVSSIALTSLAETTLKRVSQDATDIMGRTVSDSAVVRALLRYVEQHPLSWVREQVYPHLEIEMNAGVLWGRKKS